MLIAFGFGNRVKGVYESIKSGEYDLKAFFFEKRLTANTILNVQCIWRGSLMELEYLILHKDV